MAGSDERFLSRWARRKEQAREPEQAEEAPAAAAPAPDAAHLDPAPLDPAPPDPAQEAELVAQLPDIDSLDESSDFSAFMKQGVPQALKRQALRKLWRVNPVFSFLDGMNEYDEDFNIVTTGAEGVKTIYQVGKGGMLGNRDDVPPETDEAASSEEPSVTAAEPDSADQEEPDDPVAEGDEDAETKQAEPEGAEQPEALPSGGVPDRPAADALAVTAAEPQAERPRRGSARARRWGALED